MSRLNGRKLLLTRGAEDSAHWAEVLATEGAEPIVFPCIRSERNDNPVVAEQLSAALEKTDWLVFTSHRGVDAFATLAGSVLPSSIRLAAVGKVTAARLHECFCREALIGPGTAEALGAELATEASIRNGAHCLLVLAANAGRVLEHTLTEAGASVTRLDVYRTVPAAPLNPKRALSALGCDTVIFGSPSAVTGFDNQINVDMTRQFVTIGPTTSAAVRAHQWDVTAEAKEPNLSGIIESLLETGYV